MRQNQGGASACVRKRAFSRLKTEAGCGPSRCGRGNDTICGAMANFFKEPETIRPRVPAAPRARGFTGVRTLLKWRGRREGRMPARHPRAPAQEGCAKSAKTTGEGGDNRPSLRDGFTAYFELSPVNQLVATVAGRDANASSPAWRLHRRARTTRLRRPRLRRSSRAALSLTRPSERNRSLRLPCAPTRPASIASHTAFVTTRDPPLLPGGTVTTIHPILSSEKQKYFSQAGLTGILAAYPSGKSSCGSSPHEQRDMRERSAPRVWRAFLPDIAALIRATVRERHQAQARPLSAPVVASASTRRWAIRAHAPPPDSRQTRWPRHDQSEGSPPQSDRSSPGQSIRPAKGLPLFIFVIHIRRAGATIRKGVTAANPEANPPTSPGAHKGSRPGNPRRSRAPHIRAGR